MKKFCFTVDDNIRFLKDLTDGSFGGLLEHPYLQMYHRFHERFGLKVQLNLFYETDGFDLRGMTDRFREEWREHASWLKLSFHSRRENVEPYIRSDYREVFEDCAAVHREILRFATADSLAKTTTLHYCLATERGISAMRDNGVRGLLGLYGTEESPRRSYQTSPDGATQIRMGRTVEQDGMTYAGIDLILNTVPLEELLHRLEPLSDRELVKLMIHEQYFYPDYPRYQSDFEQKLETAFSFLHKQGFDSVFFEECL